eukprot:2004068-Rhodomonas_salina.1
MHAAAFQVQIALDRWLLVFDFGMEVRGGSRWKSVGGGRQREKKWYLMQTRGKVAAMRSSEHASVSGTIAPLQGATQRCYLRGAERCPRRGKRGRCLRFSNPDRGGTQCQISEHRSSRVFVHSVPGKEKLGALPAYGFPTRLEAIGNMMSFAT